MGLPRSYPGLLVVLGLMGCDGSSLVIDDVPTFAFDTWFHPDAGVAANIRFNSNEVFTFNLEGCDTAGSGHAPWVRDGVDVRVPTWTGSPLFRYFGMARMLTSSVPIFFEGGQAFDTFDEGALCPVCDGAAVVGVQSCLTPLRDGGT
ncbi:MAG TPA: hypothetical protein VFI53_17865 [Myxococcaceae bacterium]|nr:hypothetical protein [Myxococcaceae bacterium]